FSAGRFDGSEDLGDEIEFGTAFNYWSLAADRCGNAAVFYSTSGTNDAHYRYYRRGVGWLAASTIATDATTASVHKHLTFSSKGEAMLLLVRSDRVRALALTHQDHLGIDNCVRDDDCIAPRSAQHDVISGRHVVKRGTPTAPGCDAHRGKGAVYAPMIPRLPIKLGLRLPDSPVRVRSILLLLRRRHRSPDLLRDLPPGDAGRRADW